MGFLTKISNTAKALQDWWQDDTVMLPTRTAKAVEKNVGYEEQKRKIIQQTMDAEYEKVAKEEALREEEHAKHINAIREAAKAVNEQQITMNANREIDKHKQELMQQVLDNEKARQEELNRTIVDESFNFYKVGELLKAGKTLKNALLGAGCRENFAYKMDHQGRVFIRLPDEACDNVCFSVKTNMLLRDYIEKGNGFVAAVGFPEQTTLSIAAIIYDREFGFMMLKTDRYINTFVDDTILLLNEFGYMNDKLGFDRISLSKTFMKVAVTSAVCINMEVGIETEEDFNQLKQMFQYNKVAWQRFLKALEYFDIHLEGIN